MQRPPKRARVEGGHSAQLARHGITVRADGRWRSVYELLGHPDVGFEPVAAAFPWLRDISPRVLAQLQTEVRYDGYLPRQQAEIRSFQREESVALDGIAFGTIGGLSTELSVEARGYSPGFIGRRVTDPGHDTSGTGCDCRSCSQEPPHVAHRLTHRSNGTSFHVKHHSMPNDVSRETSEALERFIALLLRWNRTVNLVARNDEQRLWERHIADSLQLAAH